MGAFILQSSFRELLMHSENPLVVPSRQGKGAISIRTSQHPTVLTPDLLLSLNSAAESEVARDIIRMMQEQGWEKYFEPFEADINVAQYCPPLLVSVTSSRDYITNWVWETGQLRQKSSTDGHDPQLATHTFKKLNVKADCQKADYPDFGQPWHCLRKDARDKKLTPGFRIDLPDHDRSSQSPSNTYSLRTHTDRSGYASTILAI